MEAVSNIKYLRISPKKIKSLARLTVGLPPVQAIERLNFVAGLASKLLSQAIKSATSNAVNNLKLSQNHLIIKKVIVEKGPHFKRWQPQSRGMAHPIKKKTTHLRIEVAEQKTTIPEKKILALPKRNVDSQQVKIKKGEKT